MENAEIDKLIMKLELAIHRKMHLTFDEMEEMNVFLHKVKQNSPRPAIFSKQLDLFTK
jgi:hypothetical protein